MSVIIDRKTIIGPTEPPSLTLVFDAVYSPSYTTVEEWNTFFDLPNRGIPFTSLEIINYTTHILRGGSNITLYNDIFNPNVNFLILTSIVDNGGCIIGAENNCFITTGVPGLDALTTINLPSLITAGDYCFNSGNALTTINLPLLQTAGDYCFSSNTSITTFNLPSLQTAGNYCFFNNTSITTFNLPSLQTAGNYCFDYCTFLNTLYAPSLITAGDGCFDRCFSLATINLPSLVTAGDSCFPYGVVSSVNLPSLVTAGVTCFQGNICSIIDLPSLQTAGAGCFSPGNTNNTTLTTLNLPSLVAPNGLGGSPDDNSVFSFNAGPFNITYITNLQNLTIPSAFQTNNAGNEDGDISTLRGTSPSLTINWV